MFLRFSQDADKVQMKVNQIEIFAYANLVVDSEWAEENGRTVFVHFKEVFREINKANGSSLGFKRGNFVKF